MLRLVPGRAVARPVRRVVGGAVVATLAAGRSTLAAAASLAVLLVLVRPVPATAHGSGPAPLEPSSALSGWTLDPFVWLPLGAAGVLYGLAVRRVDAAHPDNPVPRLRVWSWVCGLLVLLVALQSAIDAYATTLFSIHMVQHLLLTMVAAPLLALGAPITLLLRVVSSGTRRRVILPVLHSLPVRIASNPVVCWVLFAGVMWASHFTPLFDAALEQPLVHHAEHALYLAVGMLFWWPVVGADPSPWRMSHAARVGYTLIGMPQSSFLGLALFSAPTVLYNHYATLGRTWGPTPLEDQQLAGGIMWAGGDLLFLVALLFAVRAWLRAEEIRGRQVDARLDRERAASGTPTSGQS